MLLRFLLISFLFSFLPALKAADCSNGRYIKQIFSQVDVTRNVKYAHKKQSDGMYIDLKYDVYQPHGDTVSGRPIMLLIHGGAYLKLLDQNSPDIVLMCDYFAKRGYVAVSIDYRQESNLLGLLDHETMVKAVARALIDTKDAVDHLMMTYQNGNPYRIDTSKAFIGGVSAGAVSSLFISYTDSLAQMPLQYQQWVTEVIGDSADYILRHKFDLVKPKVCVSISGALLDTNWVVNNGIDMLLSHGSADNIVPYKFGHPFGIQQLPVLYGGKSLYPVMVNKGIRVEFDDWQGRGHVPFMNLTFPDIIFNLIDQSILDSTERHIANFCYKYLGCDEMTTGIQQHIMKEQLSVYPNPAKNNFSISIPRDAQFQKWNVEVYDIAGKRVYQNNYSNTSGNINIEQNLNSGMYFIKMQYEKGDDWYVYTGKVNVVN
ncbi:MAG: T9SS type A sorting domain-containing protein [Bacteroidetes bacterium]|nr:T9SS type A sorting domain-containing protein [Bacteroidota bacterium]